MMKAILPLVLGSLVFGGAADASSIINIDFNSTGNQTQTGLAAAPDTAGAGAVWNPLLNSAGTAQSLDLADSDGNSSGIGFVLTGIAGSIASASGEQDRTGSHLNLMRDYVRVDSGSSTAVATAVGLFTGLTAGASYELYFYGQGENFGGGTISGGTATQGQNSFFAVGANSAQTGWDGVIGGDGVLTSGVEYVVLTGVANGSGELQFTWQNVVQGTNVGTDSAPSTAASGTLASRYGALNGIQLRPVPEPSTAFLGGLGILGLLLRRRR